MLNTNTDALERVLASAPLPAGADPFSEEELTLQAKRERIHRLEAQLASRLAQLPEGQEMRAIEAARTISAKSARAESADARYPAPDAIPDAGSDHHTRLAAVLLRCGIFGPYRLSLPEEIDDVPKFERMTFRQGVGRAELVYHGPRLAHAHLKIFLCVLALARGQKITASGVVVRCRRSDLARACGWVDKHGKVSGRALQKVWVCLKQMIGPTIEYTWAGATSRGMKASLIASAEHEEDELVVVLPRTVSQFFRYATTYLNLNLLAKCAEGLESWLYGFIRASEQRFLNRVSVRDLYAAAHSTSETPDDNTMKDFRRAVHAALEQLSALDLIVQAKKVGPGVYFIER